MSTTETTTTGTDTVAADSSERTRGPRIGENAPRPDGIPKVSGEFAFGNDMWIDGMLFGRTLRSPHPYARIVSIDISRALAMDGVHAVITADDVPGQKLYGLEHKDQPVFASEVVRFHGEPIAAVAADHPETARRACMAIEVEYEVWEPIVDAEISITAPPIHPDGNIFRHMFIRHGLPDSPESEATSRSRASTKSACRTRRSSDRNAHSAFLSRTVASSCTCRRNGSMPTGTRRRRASDFTRSRFG